MGDRSSRFEMELCLHTRSSDRCDGARITLHDCRRDESSDSDRHIIFIMESLILAQDERWRRALYMQVERERDLRVLSRVANG